MYKAKFFESPLQFYLLLSIKVKLAMLLLFHSHNKCVALYE